MDSDDDSSVKMSRLLRLAQKFNCFYLTGKSSVQNVYCEVPILFLLIRPPHHFIHHNNNNRLLCATITNFCLGRQTGFPLSSLYRLISCDEMISLIVWLVHIWTFRWCMRVFVLCWLFVVCVVKCWVSNIWRQHHHPAPSPTTPQCAMQSRNYIYLLLLFVDTIKGHPCSNTSV